MDGLTLEAARGGRPAWSAVAAHLAAVVGMLALMTPALLLGHASLAGIGATFAFFVWAIVAAARTRRRDRGGRLGGVVGDPLAMGLMMAVPYIAVGFGGHAHGGGETASSGPGAILSLLIVTGWAALRASGARADRAGRLGFWSCLLMMVGMLAAMSIPS